MNRLTTPVLEIKSLVIQRGDKITLQVDALTVNEGDVLAVIGPNGAGKSTLLLAISRLLAAERGDIHFRGQSIYQRNALDYRRRIGLVLQDPLLLDGNVFDNVALGLHFRGLSRQQIQIRVQNWLARLGIAHLSQRPAHKLSGGEAQRVSLARAFALQPELLLLDEPFSALDAPTHLRLLEDFHRLLADTKLTTVFITHDLDEALYLGQRVAVLLDGRLRQAGPPQEVFSAPNDREVAEFVGVETVIPGRVIAESEGQLTIQASEQLISAVGEAAVGQEVFVCLRPEDISLFQVQGAAISSIRNHIKGSIRRIIPHGPLTRVVVDCGYPLVALITRASAQEMRLETGQEILATFKASVAHIILR